MKIARAIIVGSTLGLMGLVPVGVLADDLKQAKEAVQQKIYEITGKDTATITFAKGSSALAESEDAQIRTTLNAVRDNSPVREVLVIAFSDMNYPHNQKQDLPKASRELAEKRGEVVKKKLEEQGAKNVKVYNMATKANWLEKTLITSDAQVKREATEKAADTDMDDSFYQALGRRLKSEDGSGKVVVVVRHDGSYAH